MQEEQCAVVHFVRVTREISFRKSLTYLWQKAIKLAEMQIFSTRLYIKWLTYVYDTVFQPCAEFKLRFVHKLDIQWYLLKFTFRRDTLLEKLQITKTGLIDYAAISKKRENFMRVLPLHWKMFQRHPRKYTAETNFT